MPIKNIAAKISHSRSRTHGLESLKAFLKKTSKLIIITKTVVIQLMILPEKSMIF
jgi:hypothetical protein